MTADTSTRRPVPSRSLARGHRPDVEGLRAVAVGLVLVYHAASGLLPGGFVGVDVFFVISGFLITGLLVREVEATGRVSLLTFYGRRAKRLLPAAGVVLAAATLLTLTFVPLTDRRAFAGDIVAGALYVVNWRLADRAVDYLAEDTGTSVVQHFWSLAVEEQFYVIWPVLILVVAWWVRRRAWPLRGATAVGLAVVALPSLAWSIYLTGVDPSRAFFVTTTRLWELSIGASVALALPLLPLLSRSFARVLGWGGLFAVLASAAVYSTETAWPGYAALLPTLGTAAVIAAAPAAGGGGPALLLARPAFVWVGGLSYSLYLWHWPLVVAATAHWGGLSVARGLVVVAASVVPAWLTHHYLENPFRYSRKLSRFPRRALAAGAGFTALGVASGLALLLAVPTAQAPPAGEARGAAVLADEPTGDPARDAARSVGVITPDPLRAPEDVPVAYADGCQVGEASSEPVACTYGDEDASDVMALVGDSKALQWLPALDAIGQERGWRVVTWTKSACPFSAARVTVDGAPYESCTRWNEQVTAALLADPPEIVLTSQGRGTAVDGAGETQAAMVAGLRQRWERLSAAGSRVVVLQDNQSPGFEVYECVAQNLDDLTLCSFERGASPSQQTLRAAAQGMAGVSLVDMTEAICPTQRCAPVIGNVLVYRQGSHLTATYVTTLAERLESSIGGL